MNMMMARRRAIIAAQEATPVDTWDSVWDYSEGLPTVDSWERTTSAVMFLLSLEPLPGRLMTNSAKR